MPKSQKVINLALQGGGAQGAYTWGVLNRLLEDERIKIEGISGTSAGAINTAALIDGYSKNGRAGAMASLENFWQRLSEYGHFSPMQQMPWERFVEGWNLDSSGAYTMHEIFTHMFSPKERNPFNINPFRNLLEECIDFKTVNKHDDIKLFIAATCVQSGLQHIFAHTDLTVDILLATSCKPFTFQPVKVGRNHFWDGGYSGNPAIWPLIYHCDSHDIMLVQINPFVRKEIPQKGHEIVNRLNEINFNSCLLGELRSIRFVSKLIRQGKLGKDEYKDLRIHMISSPEELHELNASSKSNLSWDFFLYLRDIGYKMMNKWLKNNYSKLGQHSTFDIDDIIPPEPKLSKVTV